MHHCAQADIVVAGPTIAPDWHTSQNSTVTKYTFKQDNAVYTDIT